MKPDLLAGASPEAMAYMSLVGSRCSNLYNGPDIWCLLMTLKVTEIIVMSLWPCKLSATLNTQRADTGLGWLSCRLPELNTFKKLKCG